MDPLTKLYAKILAQTQKHMLEVLSETLNGLAKDAMNPERMAELMKNLGIDPSQLSGMMGKGGERAHQPGGLSPYDILNLSESASNEEVKERYLEMMKRFHPDRAGKAFEGVAKAINKAYEMICRQRGMK